MFKPLCTARVWFPKYVPSDITSLNQKNILDINNISAENSQCPAYWKLWKVKTAEVVKVNKLIEQKSGQGEGDTKWKGWPWNALLLRFDINFIY